MSAAKKYLSRGMLLALLIAFFAYGAAAVVSRHVLEQLPHLEDEFAYLFQAKLFAGGHAWVQRNNTDHDRLFWQPFVLQPSVLSPDVEKALGSKAPLWALVPDYMQWLKQPASTTPVVEKRFAKYTPGWPMILSIGVALGEPWVINAFLAMLSVALVYRMAREIFDETVGIVAALLLAISPMALLINATLMSHTSAMFLAIVFTYAYWRTTKHRRGRYWWAIIGGLCLGWIIATRPLTAIAIAAPIGLHALSRLMDAPGTPSPLETAHGITPPPDPAVKKPANWGGMINMFKVMVVMAVFVIPTGALWPIFNQIWTGDYRTNVYTLLWSYDNVGFGPDKGLNPGGHSLAYGWRNARSDLEAYMNDLFGWQLNPTIADYMSSNLGWGAGLGLSWILILAGLIAGRKSEWLFVFFEFLVAIVLAQLLYWIGSSVNGSAAYSVRYYYEATFGVAIVSAYGAVAWARSLKKKEGKVPVPVPALPSKVASIKTSAVTLDYLNGPEEKRPVYEVVPRQPNFVDRLKLAWDSLWPGYFILLVACGLSVAGFAPARFRQPLPPSWNDGLYHYNKAGKYQLDNIQTIRNQQANPKQPVLILVLNSPIQGVDDDWRDYAAAMAYTSPYLDSDIIVVRVFDKEEVPNMVKRFPGRLVLYQIGEHLATSIDEVNNLAEGNTTITTP